MTHSSLLFLYSFHVAFAIFLYTLFCRMHSHSHFLHHFHLSPLHQSKCISHLEQRNLTSASNCERKFRAFESRHFECCTNEGWVFYSMKEGAMNGETFSKSSLRRSKETVRKREKKATGSSIEVSFNLDFSRERERGGGEISCRTDIALRDSLFISLSNLIDQIIGQHRSTQPLETFSRTASSDQSSTISSY